MNNLIKWSLLIDHGLVIRGYDVLCETLQVAWYPMLRWFRLNFVELGGLTWRIRIEMLKHDLNGRFLLNKLVHAFPFQSAQVDDLFWHFLICFFRATLAVYSLKID